MHLDSTVSQPHHPRIAQSLHEYWALQSREPVATERRRKVIVNRSMVGD